MFIEHKTTYLGPDEFFINLLGFFLFKICKFLIRVKIF